MTKKEPEPPVTLLEDHLLRIIDGYRAATATATDLLAQHQDNLTSAQTEAQARLNESSSSLDGLAAIQKGTSTPEMQHAAAEIAHTQAEVARLAATTDDIATHAALADRLAQVIKQFRDKHGGIPLTLSFEPPKPLPATTVEPAPAPEQVSETISFAAVITAGMAAKSKSDPSLQSTETLDSITPKRQPYQEKPANTFTNWKDFFGDYRKDQHKSLQTLLGNIAGNIKRKFPSLFDPGATVLEILENSYDLTVEEVSKVISPTDSRTFPSLAKLLCAIYRNAQPDKPFQPPDNFAALAIDIQQGKFHQDKTLFEIIDQYKPHHSEVGQVAHPDKTTLETQITSHEVISEKTTTIAAIHATIKDLQEKLNAKGVKGINWPINSAQLHMLTPIKLAYEQQVRDLKLFTFPAAETHHHLFNLIDVIKLVILHEKYKSTERLANASRRNNNGARRIVQLIDQYIIEAISNLKTAHQNDPNPEKPPFPNWIRLQEQ